MFHREGNTIILITIIVLSILGYLGILFLPKLSLLILFVLFVFLILVLQFFRNPSRKILNKDENIIFAPADGKIVVLEETKEEEYLNEQRIQISIFMSPLNVHVNRIPFSGVVKYFKYHPGKFLVAWHPKSSTENERTTTVIQGSLGNVLVRQIAGAVARRIKWYVKDGDQVMQGEELGFIKFGSRVDLFLPLNADILVNIGDVVKGNITEIAKFKLN